jgi:AbrB family looped-hinge helix DNA binding protein
VVLSGVPQSRITSQGQISIPAEIRRKLGVGPGSLIEWKEEGGQFVVRRAGRYSFEDIQQALFPDGPPSPRTLPELKEGVRRHIRNACPKPNARD